MGRLPVVWACSPRRTAWAMLHTVKRHGGRVEDVVVIELRVPRRWLRRSRRKLWYCPRDLPPGRFLRVISFGEIAGASVEPVAV